MPELRSKGAAGLRLRLGRYSHYISVIAASGYASGMHRVRLGYESGMKRGTDRVISLSVALGEGVSGARPCVASGLQWDRSRRAVREESQLFPPIDTRKGY